MCPDAPPPLPHTQELRAFQALEKQMSEEKAKRVGGLGSQSGVSPCD
jgi:hypothetical protein